MYDVPYPVDPKSGPKHGDPRARKDLISTSCSEASGIRRASLRELKIDSEWGTPRAAQGLRFSRRVASWGDMGWDVA